MIEILEFNKQVKALNNHMNNLNITKAERLLLLRTEIDYILDSLK